MANRDLDYILIGPAYPYRGGISDTQHQLAISLQKQGKKIQLITFRKLYPKLLFPGKSQFTSESAPENIAIEPKIHAFNPLRWKRIAKQINQQKPKQVVFRYYTPFLAMAYGRIAKSLHPTIKKIALVDNWSPHESTLWDGVFNRYFGKQMDGFTTLSKNVAHQLQDQFTKPVWDGFHPIAEDLPPPLDKKGARKKLKWSLQKKVVLFYGLIRKYKGLDLLISAFAEKELSDQNIILYVAGECYEDPKKYTDLVKQLQLEDRVFFDFHFQSPTETQQLFSATDIVAQTYHSATQSGVT
ncbi:MAG: glycosyltransferase, partial [Flavobacteriaceae bacterium]